MGEGRHDHNVESALVDQADDGRDAEVQPSNTPESAGEAVTEPAAYDSVPTGAVGAEDPTPAPQPGAEIPAAHTGLQHDPAPRHAADDSPDD